MQKWFYRQMANKNIISIPIVHIYEAYVQKNNLHLQHPPQVNILLLAVVVH